MYLLLRAIHCLSSKLRDSCSISVSGIKRVVIVEVANARLVYQNAGGCTLLWLRRVQIEIIFRNKDYRNELPSAFH
jgi:hypothetical protein